MSRLEEIATKCETTTQEIQEILHRKTLDKIDLKEAKKDAHCWDVWVYHVIATYYPNVKVNIPALGRQGVQVRRHLVNGRIPRSWNAKLNQLMSEQKETTPIDDVVKLFGESSKGLSEEQLKKRKTAISATEISAIMGHNPWKTPLDVYLDKTEGSSFKGNNSTRMGLILEPAILWMYLDWLGGDTSDVTYRFDSIEHDTEPWMIATPDCVARGIVADMKSTMVDRSEPPQYQIDQVHWQHMVLSSRGWELSTTMHIPTLTARYGFDFGVWEVEYNPEYAKELIRRGREFYENHLSAGVPPPPTETHKDIVRVFETEKTEDLLDDTNGSVERMVAELAKWKQRKTQTTKAIEILESRIKMAIGDHAGIRIGDDIVKFTSNSRVNWRGIVRKMDPDLESVDEYSTVSWSRYAKNLKPTKNTIEAFTDRLGGKRMLRIPKNLKGVRL